MNEYRPISKIDHVQEDMKNAEEFLRLSGVILLEDRAEPYVKLATVHRLSEYAKDENLFLSLASLFAGAMLGVIVNVATSDSPRMTKAGWVTLIFSAAVTSVFTILWRCAQQRSQRIVDGLLSRMIERSAQQTSSPGKQNQNDDSQPFGAQDNSSSLEKV